MINKIAFLPTEVELAQLNRLHNGIEIFRPIDPTNGLSEVVLKAENGTVVRIGVDYDDVRFKFECFHLTVEAITEPLGLDTKVVAKIVDWKSLECLYLVEWERPAIAGEVPPNSDQIVRRSGLLSQVPDDAIAACVAWVGVLFLDHKGRPRLLIKTDVDSNNPLSVAIVENGVDIDAAIAKYERVNIAVTLSWQLSMRGWVERKPE